MGVHPPNPPHFNVGACRRGSFFLFAPRPSRWVNIEIWGCGGGGHPPCRKCSNILSAYGLPGGVVPVKKEATAVHDVVVGSGGGGGGGRGGGWWLVVGCGLLAVVVAFVVVAAAVVVVVVTVAAVDAATSPLGVDELRSSRPPGWL